MASAREVLEQVFMAGVEAVEPMSAVASVMEARGDELVVAGGKYDLGRFENIYVLGAGKGTAPMARAVEDMLGERVTDGLVVVKRGHGHELSRVRMIEAAHPVPDEAGERGSRELLRMASRAGENDLVLALITGGASALLPAPAQGLTLEHERRATSALLACGADIHRVNALRKHLSAIKGGLLARAAHPARVVALIISDVIGDDLDTIASGPTAPDNSTFAQALEVVRDHDLGHRLPAPVLERLERGAAGELPETPKPGDPVFDKVRNVVVAGNATALDAAAEKARELGYSPLILTSRMCGEAREAARLLASVGLEAEHSGNPARPPVMILAGGETTVTIRGAGKGGRNQEMALAAAPLVSGTRVSALFAGTDGTDGPTDAAGAFALPDTMDKAGEAGLDQAARLADNDAYNFFKPLDGLLVTGPTRTNVMDLALVLVDGE